MCAPHAACVALLAHLTPITPTARRDQRLGYVRNTQGAGQGSTGETFAHLLGAVLGIFMLYLCIGALWRYFELGMRGVEVIPHLSFWRDLPVLCFNMGAGAMDELRGLVENSAAGVPNEALDEHAVGGAAAAPLLARRR